jgi:hypothetical protein
VDLRQPSPLQLVGQMMHAGPGHPAARRFRFSN